MATTFLRVLIHFSLALSAATRASCGWPRLGALKLLGCAWPVITKSPAHRVPGSFVVAISMRPRQRNLQVWKVGFKGWERAGNVPELAAFVHEPPPLPHEPPPLPQMTHRTSQGIWRSAAAISVCVAVALAHSGPYAAFAALLIAVPLDWATRRRQQFAQRLRQDIEHRMMGAR
jgi:hypothetical protein